MKIPIAIPPKPPLVILHDTIRLLRDIAKFHPSPDYVLAYAYDLERATKQITQAFKRMDQ